MEAPSFSKAIFIADLKSFKGNISLEGLPLSKYIISLSLVFVLSFFKLKEETKVPLPIALYTYPSFSNNSYTFTIVALFTFIKSDNFLIGGSFSCSFISPLTINFFI